jgi:drug/metabolite transporter (DMT)-like permease
VSGQALLVLPAAAALGYVAAVLLLKRALLLGCTEAQVNLAANLVPAVLFQLLWLHGDVVHWGEIWRPLVATVTFLLGQIFTFRALRAGEVSVATPLLGTKVLLTAIWSALLFGQAIEVRWWLGAIASTAGIVLITGATLRSLAPRLLQADALCSIGAAASFGLTDVLVQHWAADMGVPAFIMVMFGSVGVASVFIFVPGQGRRIIDIPSTAASSLSWGATILGIQALAMALALGLHGSATAVNVVYSSRAVWSVVLAWVLARRLGSPESRDTPAIMVRRLAGAILVFSAVVTVIV